MSLTTPLSSYPLLYPPARLHSYLQLAHLVHHRSLSLYLDKLKEKLDLSYTVLLTSDAEYGTLLSTVRGVEVEEERLLRKLDELTASARQPKTRKPASDSVGFDTTGRSPVSSEVGDPLDILLRQTSERKKWAQRDLQVLWKRREDWRADILKQRTKIKKVQTQIEEDVCRLVVLSKEV